MELGNSEQGKANLKNKRWSILSLGRKAGVKEVEALRNSYRKGNRQTSGPTLTVPSNKNSHSNLFNFTNRANQSQAKGNPQSWHDAEAYDEQHLQHFAGLRVPPESEVKEKIDHNSDSGQLIRKGKGKAHDSDLPIDWAANPWSNPWMTRVTPKRQNGEDSGNNLTDKAKPGKEKIPRISQDTKYINLSTAKSSGYKYSNSSKGHDYDSDALNDSHNSASTPPTMEEIDRWYYHTDLQRFGKSLHTAATSVFPNNHGSRYHQVSVLMLSWRDEDPQLPVTLELDKLAAVFEQTYYFTVNRWAIPDENAHFRLAETVMAFVEPTKYSEYHLKIVYYAGHAKLLDTRTLGLTSWRNKGRSKPPMVKWGAIQSFIEESPSDALILLDCCASGTANTSEGSGVTELIAACAWNQIANGVGPYSLTSALAIELDRLRTRKSFSIGELYRNVYLRTQSWMPESKAADGRNVERHPAPIHLVLTQDSKKARSIQLSVHSSYPLPRVGSGSGLRPTRHPSTVGAQAPDPMLLDATGMPSHDTTTGRFPRIAFAVRLNESFKPTDDMEHLLLEWLRELPLDAKEVKIEAGFDSFSTLAIISVPFSWSAYMPTDPAIISLGPILSENRMITPSVHVPESTHLGNKPYPNIIRSPSPIYSEHSEESTFDSRPTFRATPHGFQYKRVTGLMGTATPPEVPQPLGVSH